MKIKTVLLFLAALVVAGIGGCASDTTPLHFNKFATATVALGHPTLSKFKGRAFYLRSVSTNYDHHWLDVSWDVLKSRHCLPHSVYESELRYDLLRGWEHEHLDRGTQPPVPVDVVIRVLESTLGFYHESNIITLIQLPGTTIHTWGAGTENPVYLATWDYARYIIPTAAVQIIYSLHYLQAGKPGKLSGNRDVLWSAWGGRVITWFTGHKYGISNPMSKTEAETATGKSASRLAALCEAGGG